MISKRTFFISLLVALLGFGFKYFTHVEFSPIVETKSGAIRGFLSKSRLGRDFYQFRGIPYAKPPVGELRFSSPQPPEPWNGVFDALYFGQKCMQIDGLTRTVVGSETCLFLNIFSPKAALNDPEDKKKLPVIVFIHGGYFMVGASSYMGPEYLMDDQNIVLVTINYRLNVFGFLNTLDSSSLGNYGLKDQNLALQWVKDNIFNFGGDPDRVILSGQSAGSASVNFHMLSKMSRGLFSGVIMSSGTSIKPWSLAPDPKGQAKYLAEKVNCPTSSSKKLVNCLRQKSAFELTAAQVNALSSPEMNTLEIFAPSVENCAASPGELCFLPTHPYDVLKSGNAARVPMLTGLNKDEGALPTSRIYLNDTLKRYVEDNWNTLSPNFFSYDKSRADLTSEIRQFYLKDSVSDPFRFTDKFQNITDIFTDRLYAHATRETAKIQAKFSPVYLYYFTYPLYRGMGYLSDINHEWPILPQFVLKEIAWYLNEYIFGTKNLHLGTSHGDDVALIWKFPVFRLPPNSKDFSMSRTMVKLWIDFAHNPHNLTFGRTPWPPIAANADKLHYMLISDTEAHGSLIPEPFADRMAFWDRVNLPWKL